MYGRGVGGGSDYQGYLKPTKEPTNTPPPPPTTTSDTHHPPPMTPSPQ